MEKSTYRGIHNNGLEQARRKLGAILWRDSVIFGKNFSDGRILSAILLESRSKSSHLGRRVVALPLVVPPSCPLVMPPSHPLAILSLHRPLVVSSHWLVVVSPLVAPPSHLPLTLLLSHHLAPAGCCIASCLASLLFYCHAALLSSCCPLTALLSHCLITPAGCCIASRCTALLLSSHCDALSLICSGWLLRCLLLCRPLVLSSSCCAPAGCCVASIKLCPHRHRTHPPPPPPLPLPP
jgi:hypothetical protein